MLSTMSLSTGSVCWITAFTGGQKNKKMIRETTTEPKAEERERRLTVVEVGLPRRDAHGASQDAVLSGERRQQAAVVAGARLPLLLVLREVRPRQQQHVGQSPAHQHVSLEEQTYTLFKRQIQNKTMKVANHTFYEMLKSKLLLLC